VGRQVQFVHFDRQKFRKSASMVLATSSSAQDLLTARSGLEPLLAALESLSERIREYNERIEELAQQSYPQTALLKQIKGVGTLIALIIRLTLEDPHRFGKSLDVGCYLGLQPGRRNLGQSEPQMHISKEGDPYLRTLLVQGALHMLGPFGVDCDLRPWGLKLAERGRKRGKARLSPRLESWRCCCIARG
jgi:transposase